MAADDLPPFNQEEKGDISSCTRKRKGDYYEYNDVAPVSACSEYAFSSLSVIEGPANTQRFNSIEGVSM